jgi:hypothetical protein
MWVRICVGHGEDPFLFCVYAVYIGKRCTLVNEQFAYRSLIIGKVEIDRLLGWIQPNRKFPHCLRSHFRVSTSQSLGNVSCAKASGEIRLVLGRHLQICVQRLALAGWLKTPSTIQ